MSVALVGRSVRRPARVTDPGQSFERFASQAFSKISELALGTPALQMAVLDGRHTGGVVPSILEPPKGIDQIDRHGFGAKYADYSAHSVLILRESALSRRIITCSKSTQFKFHCNLLLSGLSGFLG